MKFTILQQDFLPKIQSVARSVGVRSNLPVLDNILISAEGKRVKIAATNLEIGIIKYVSADVEVEGEITVPAKTIVDLVSSLEQVKVEFESEEEILEVRSNKFKASINGISASEFPVIPITSEQSIVFSKQVLLESAQILFASAVDSGRPVLTGILTEVKGKNLDLVATDGFRLAHRQINLGKETQNFKSLIPRTTFEEVVRVLSEEDVEEVGISAAKDQNQIIFTLGQTILSSRLIEGQFPSWEKIIPTQIVSNVIAERSELQKAIKLASVFAKNEANIITLVLQEKGLSLQSSAKQLGSQENEIDAQVEGEKLTIAFNSKFLLDAISAASTAQIKLEFSGPLSATIIKPVGVEGLQYIVMPVRMS